MDFESLADTLKALADPTCLKVVALLSIRDCLRVGASVWDFATCCLQAHEPTKSRWSCQREPEMDVGVLSTQ